MEESSGNFKVCKILYPRTPGLLMGEAARPGVLRRVGVSWLLQGAGDQWVDASLLPSPTSLVPETSAELQPWLGLCGAGEGGCLEVRVAGGPRWPR